MNVLARIAVLGTLPLVLLASGCNSQSEGQRCTLPGDCESPLACVKFGALDYMVCCSSDVNRPSTAAACNPGVSVVDAGSVDTGSGPSGDDGAVPDGADQVDGAPEDAGAE